VLLFGGPVNSAHESLFEFRDQRKFDRLQTTIAHNFQLSVQPPPQFDLFPVPVNPAANLRRLKQPDVRLVQRQFVSFVNLGELAALFFQLVQFNSHDKALKIA